MVTIEEMEGAPQHGMSLSRTIESIFATVRKSRGEPQPVQKERRVTAAEMKSVFRQELAPRPRIENGEAQERMDLAMLRGALYGA